MTKQQISYLMSISFVNKEPDPLQIEEIAKSLARQELKEYIRVLRNHEKQRNVYVYTSFPLKEENKKMFEELYPNKKVQLRIDPSLLVGIKIVNNDLVTEYDLSNTFLNLAKQVAA